MQSKYIISGYWLYMSHSITARRIDRAKRLLNNPMHYMTASLGLTVTLVLIHFSPINCAYIMLRSGE